MEKRLSCLVRGIVQQGATTHNTWVHFIHQNVLKLERRACFFHTRHVCQGVRTADRESLIMLTGRPPVPLYSTTLRDYALTHPPVAPVKVCLPKGELLGFVLPTGPIECELVSTDKHIFRHVLGSSHRRGEQPSTSNFEGLTNICGGDEKVTAVRCAEWPSMRS